MYPNLNMKLDLTVEYNSASKVYYTTEYYIYVQRQSYNDALYFA